MSALLTELKYFHFFVLVAVTCGQKFSDLGPTRYDMIHYLLDERRYDPSLPPEFYTGNLTTVSVALSIFDLNSESDIAMEFECTLYLRMNWTDKRLDYTANKTTYDVLDLGDAIVDKAWVPDLYFHHSRKTEMHGLFSKNQLLYIYRNGSVLYSGRFNIMWHCPMNLKWYPFDEPNCTITIQSYSLDKDYLLLKWNESEAVWIESDVKDLKTSNTTEKHTYRSPYTNPVGNFSTLEAVLLLPRPKRSLVVVYIVPPILFSGESLSCFLLGEEVGPRITVTFLALLQVILQSTGIYYNKVPAISALTNLDIWMLGNLVFLATVFAVNIGICHRVIKKKMKEKEKADKEKETNKEDGDKTKQQNLDHSKEKLKARKMVEKAMEVNLTDVDERKHQNLDTLKDKEEEMEIGANGEQSSTEGGNERRQQDVGTSKDKEVEREIGTNGEQSNTEGGNERKQQGVGASKDKEEEREIGANAEQSSPEGGNERRQQDVGTSKDKEEEREIWANGEQSSPEDGNERKQQDVGTSKDKEEELVAEQRSTEECDGDEAKRTDFDTSKEEMQIVEKTKKKSTKDGSGTNQQNLDTSKDKEEEMEMAEKAKQSSTEDGDDTKETNLDTSKDKKQEHIKERSTKDGNETKNSNVDTSKDTEEEREIGANGEQSLNEGGNERKQQDVGTSKDTEEEREIGANGEQSLNEGGNERKQQDVGASKDRGEEREFGTNGEQSGAEGGSETKQQDVGTSKDKEEERETGANSEHSSTEGGNKRKQQGVGTSKTKRTRRSTKDDEMPLLENQQRQDGTSENESRAPSNDPIIQIEPDPSENELKELKEDFLQLLKDNKDITTSTKLEIAQTIVEDDPRYKRACTTDKVPQWYTEYIYEKVKEDFHTLLDEKANTIKTWRRAKMIIDHDPRYEVIGNEDVGKQFFLEYWSKNCLQCCCKKKCSCCTCCCDCLTCCCNRCTRCCNKWCSWNVFWFLLLGISYSGSALAFLVWWAMAKD